MLDSQQTIVLMQQQIDKRIEHLAYDDPQVTTWRQLSARIVEEAFGRKHPNYSRFIWVVGHYNSKREVHQQDFAKEVRRKKANLHAYIEELRLFPTVGDVNRPDLSQLRRRLLSEIADARRQPDQPYVNYKYLPATTLWAQPFILEQLEILWDEGRVDLKRLKNSDEAMVNVTPKGRKSLEVDEQDWQEKNGSQIVQNTVNIHNSHVENLAQVSGSAHAQIKQGTESANLKGIFDQIDRMIAQIRSSGLALEARADAEIEAEQLKTELQKSAPNPGRIREMLAVFGSLNSVVQFGENLPHLVHEVMKHLNLG